MIARIAQASSAHQFHLVMTVDGPVIASEAVNGRDATARPCSVAPERSDWARLSKGWTGRIEGRIRELERLRAGLTECIGCGCLSLDRCQLANPGDRAARRGAGPRYWTEAK